MTESINFKSRGVATPTTYCPGGGKEPLNVMTMPPPSYLNGSCPECYHWYPLRVTGRVVSHAVASDD